MNKKELADRLSKAKDWKIVALEKRKEMKNKIKKLK